MVQQAHHVVIDKATQWYCAASLPAKTIPEEVSSTRDVFQARLDRFYRDLTRKSKIHSNEAALLTAVAGEIGNNCFDHNLGQWQDQPGCWFDWEENQEVVRVIITDRGQGVLRSLKRVKPDLQNEAEALKIAFEKTLSGRSPEQRGNGLKFVRSILNGHQERGLCFCSGSAIIVFGGRNIDMPGGTKQMASKKGQGTLALIEWKNK